MTNQGYRARRQQGMALVTGLIFLVILTVIGVSAMRTTTLDERMAGNLRAHNVAFQSAEAALRGGETWLQTSAANQATAKGNARIVNPGAWDGAASPTPTVAAYSIADWLAQPVAEPAFYVEEPIMEFPKDGNVGWGDGSSDPQIIYTITAYATGSTNTAISILQSRYEPW